MKAIKFIAFLYYKYYSKGPTASIAYMKTIGVMVFLTFILILNILISANLEAFFLYEDSDSRGMKYLKMAIYTLPLFLIFLFLFPESKLKQLNYPDSKIKRGNTMLLIGTIAVILSLPITALIKYRT